MGLVALTTEIVVMAAVVETMYLIFAGVVWRGMRVGAASCGCFGAIDTPPSWTHVAGNLVLAGSSLWALGGRSPLEVMENQPAADWGSSWWLGCSPGSSSSCSPPFPRR